MNLRARSSLSVVWSFSLSLVLSGFVGVPAARAETVVPAKDPGDALMKNLLDALKANDYTAFVADGTAKHKTSGKAAFGRLSGQLGPLLTRGYKTTVLTILRKPDVTIHLWKLEPAGANEDFELRLVTKDGKVDSFSVL
jgi:hypothetical protein